jgi:nondiscriminating aspartyl-tRNA synthetase
LPAVSFLIVRDRGGLAQVVVSDELGREQLDGLNEETVVSVDGMVTPNAKAPGGFELTNPQITKLSSRRRRHP